MREPARYHGELSVRAKQKHTFGDEAPPGAVRGWQLGWQAGLVTGPGTHERGPANRESGEEGKRKREGDVQAGPPLSPVSFNPHHFLRYPNPPPIPPNPNMERSLSCTAVLQLHALWFSQAATGATCGDRMATCGLTDCDMKWVWWQRSQSLTLGLLAFSLSALTKEAWSEEASLRQSFIPLDLPYC